MRHIGMSARRPPVDHVHGALHGLDAEPVQKLLEGLTFQVSNDGSVRPVSADAWGWRSPNPPGISRRLLVSDCHIPECVCRMARPIMFWAQTDTALLVLTLVIVAKRVASSFSRRLIEPASRKDAPRRFYTHHRGAGSGILDRSAALEAGFGPVVDVTLAGDVVRRHAIVR